MRLIDEDTGDIPYSEDELKKLKIAKEIEKLHAEAIRAKWDAERLEQEARLALNNNKYIESKAEFARVYTFYNPVKNSTVYDAIREISHWARRDPELPIKVVLNSPGGSVLDGLAFYDFLIDLRESGHHVEVVALGMAASMGGIILQAGTERTMGKNAWLLIHEVSDVVIGNFSEMEDQIEFTKRLQDNLLEILAERSNMTATQIKRKWKKKDWWLSAAEALELGFIDKVQ